LMALVAMNIDHLPRTFMLWFILFGIAYLAGACLLRGRIGRVGCLIVGTAAGATWSYGQILLFAVAPPFLASGLGFPATKLSASEILAAFWASPAAWQSVLVSGAAGCFSGWLLWRIAVRPAPEPLPTDIVEVFE
jgi:hypothetical protein